MSEFVYGRRPIFEALQAGKRSLHKLWMLEGTGGGAVEKIVTLARERGIPVEWVRHDRLDHLVQGHHQGMVAQVSAAAFEELEDFLDRLGPEAPALLVALDEIQDPQNVGAILRNAAFFGVRAAIMPRWRSAPVSGTAVRVSAGGAEHLPLIRVRNLADSIRDLQKAGFEVVGADMQGEALWNHAPSRRTVLVFGSEGKGLRRLVRERCDKLIGIPKRGAIDSLNVGSAAAIFLYEFRRPTSHE